MNAEFEGQTEAEYALFSIMDAAPLVSVSAERAAKQILAAAGRGDAELVISRQAKMANQLNSIFPEVSSAVLAAAAAVLPSGNGSADKRTGLESTSYPSP